MAKVLVLMCPGCGAISGGCAVDTKPEWVGEYVQQAASDGRRIELRDGPVRLPEKCNCSESPNSSVA